MLLGPDHSGLYDSSSGCSNDRPVILLFTPLQFHEAAKSCRLILIQPSTCHSEILHAVKPECAEILPELVPGGKHPAIRQVPVHERTHAAPGPVPLSVPVVELRDLPLADRLAEQGQIRRRAVSRHRVRSLSGRALRPGPWMASCMMNLLPGMEIENRRARDMGSGSTSTPGSDGRHGHGITLVAGRIRRTCAQSMGMSTPAGTGAKVPLSASSSCSLGNIAKSPNH